MSDLYKEYSRILKDDKFHQDGKSSVKYRRKEDGLTIEFYSDKKGKHVKKIYNNDNSYIKIKKTWILDGNTYMSKYTYKQYDENVKEYMKNGLLHRDNKPAYVCKTYKYRPIFTIEKWFQEGVLHNSEGHAYFFEEDNLHDDDPYYYSEEKYFWKGQKMDKEKYYEHVSKIKRQELSKTLYDCNIVCKDVCGIISSFVW